MSSNLPRVTQKIFAENAGDNIGQFGSALSGTANRTGDIEAIQALPAWGQGWAGAVISERDYPPLEEMTGVQKVASQQIAYLLQKGFPEWDEGTTYFANTSFCQVNGVVYKSLTDNNIGNNPTTDTTNWETWKPLEGTYANIDLSNLSEIGNSHFATPDLSNLSATGLDKINQSKALETGNVSSDKDVYADVLKYAHSTFDASKFTVVGTPTITDDGIASGFTARKSYVYIPCDLSSAESWRIRIRQKFIDGNTSCPVSFCSALNNTSEIFRLQFNNVNQRLIVIGNTPHTILKQFPDLNTYYDFEISYNGSEMSVETFKKGISVQKETFEQENIFNVNGYIVIGGSLEANTANAQNLIDLKYFLAKTDNMPFLSGNKTGIDVIKPDNYEVVGSPNITVDGILTSAQTAGSGVKIPLDVTSSNYRIYLPFKTGEILPNYYLCQGSFKIYLSSFGVGFVYAGASDISIASNLGGTLLADTEYLIFIERNNNTYTAGVKKASDEDFVTRAKEITDEITNNYLNLGLYTAENSGTVDIDLNKVKEYSSDNLISQACLKIPYTLSKTGSKIVDVAYRDRVRDMYEQYGYAPFYTIDEDNKNFTLPMGEVYGMIEKTIQTVTSVGRPIFCLNGETLGNNEIWLEGATVSRTTYAELFAFYGTTYGEGDGSTTFELPDFRNRTLWGSDTFGYIEAGLPNITGSLGSPSSAIGGAFYYGSRFGGNEGGGYSFFNTYFDASRVNSIYGKSDTVQPSSIKVRVKTRYK